MADGIQTRKAKFEYPGLSILEVECEDTGDAGGDAGHGGFVRVKFKDLASFAMEAATDGRRPTSCESFEFVVRGDSERGQLKEALRALVGFLE